jgi:hypothetical protein
MSADSEQAREALRGFIHRNVLRSQLAEVLEVEGNFCVVKTIGSEETFADVNINAKETSSGFTLIPTVGSTVLIGLTESNKAQILMFSDVESVKIHGDNLGGLIIIEELVKQLGIVTDRIDKVYSAINDGVPIAQDGGAGYQSTMKIILATQAETEDYKDIENETVKHGN